MTAVCDPVVDPGHFPVHAELTSPALIVDRDKIAANIASAADRAARRGAALRPHAKTHKSLRIGRLQIAAGAVGLTTATLSEALVFARGGVDDIFVAYPVWANGQRVAILRELADTVSHLRVGIDSALGAEVLGAAMHGAARPLQVLVELDSGGGRSGVSSPEQAIDVAAQARRAGLEVVGVFTHGGHSYRARKGVPGAGHDEVTALARYSDLLSGHGHDIRVRSAGSTPTSALEDRDGVNEERPGTYVFNDRHQVALGSCRWSDVALRVQATVVSVGRGHVVLDAGAKVLAADLPPSLEGHGLLPAHPRAVIARLYDHHAVVTGAAGDLPELGAIVAVIPNHVCPVVNLADRLHVVSGGRVVDSWPVDARGAVV